MMLGELWAFMDYIRDAQKLEGFVESDHDVIWFPLGPAQLPLTEAEQDRFGVYHDEENECWAAAC